MTTVISHYEWLTGCKMHCYLDFLCPNLDAKIYQSQCQQKTHNFMLKKLFSQVRVRVVIKNFSAGELSIHDCIVTSQLY